MLSFCYLIIVRIIEIVTKATGNNGDARLHFFEWVTETAKKDGFMSFDDITNRYDIDIQAFTYSDEKSDEKKPKVEEAAASS